MKLFGVDELKEAFSGVTKAMRNRILKAAVTDAAEIIKPPLYFATPVAVKTGPSAKFPVGTTQAATTFKIKTYRKSGAIVAVIGHKHPQGSPAGWRERGTKPRFTRTGHRTGFETASPFFQPVFDRTKGIAMQAMRDRIAAELDRYNKREAKKFSKFLDSV